MTEDDEVHTSTRVTIWDGWRGLAIALVLCGHFFNVAWLHEDRMGVDLFFGLSGMLMSIILFEKRMSLKHFYIRRFSRIFPALLVLVVCLFSLATLASYDIAPAELPASLLFIRTYFPQDPHIWQTQTATAHLWSLNVEEHSYILMSILAIMLTVKRATAFLQPHYFLLAIAATCIVFSTYYYVSNTEAQFELLSIRTESAASCVFFSAGYCLLKRRAQWLLPQSVLLALMIVLVLCYAYFIPLPFRFTVAPVLIGIIVNHLEDLRGLVKALFNNPALRWLGICSFSIYLWQQPFFEFSWAIPGGLYSGLALSVIAGAVSFYGLENPLRKAINSKWSARPVYRTARKKVT